MSSVLYSLGNFYLSMLLAPLTCLFYILSQPSASDRDIVANETESIDRDLYCEWKTHEVVIDQYYGVDDWARSPEDRAYDAVALMALKNELEECRRKDDLLTMVSRLRQESSRNVYRILSPQLYTKSKIQTKRIIHEYIREVRRCIQHLDQSNITINLAEIEEKRRTISDMKQALGRTTLLLQGGAMLSMCHIGVVRALYRRRLLPRVITGTGTGAIVAALVGSATEIELPNVLNGEVFDLSAFDRARAQRKGVDSESWMITRYWRTFIRRIDRLYRTGHVLDIRVVEECVRDNLGDLTFEEAWERSNRILNITIAMPDIAGVPQLLNYVTSPHVLIRSAVTASLASSRHLYAPVQLLCKNDTGAIERYFASDASYARSNRVHIRQTSPLSRMGQLFNVNHYIVSQTRPYVIPFLQLQDRTRHWPVAGLLVRLVYSESLYWMNNLRLLGWLPTFMHRILLDEVVPSSALHPKVVVVPQLSLRDYFSALDLPTPAEINRLADIGESSVWPLIYQLKIRCAIETELLAAYEAESSSRPARFDGYR